MQSKAKVVLEIVTDAKQAEKQAKQIGEKVAKSAEKGSKKLTFGQKLKQNLEQLKIGIQNLGIGGDRLDKLGQLFAGGGWIAVAAAGVTLLAKGAMDLWDKMTVSAQQAMAKARALREYSQSQLSQSFKDESDSSGYFDRLKQLNEQEQLSNLHKMEAIAIVNNLSKVYGDLGLTISGVTGKVLGLDEAMEKVAQRNRDKKIKESQNIVKQSENFANAQAEGMIEGMIGNWFTQIFSDGQSKFFSEFQKSRKQIFDKGINAKMNENFTYQKKRIGYSIGGRPQYKTIKRETTQEQRKDAQLWNSGLQGKVKWLNKKIDSSTDEELIEKYTQLRASIEKLIEVRKQHESIKQHGFKTDDDYLKNLKQQNEETKKLRQGIKKQAEQFMKSRKAKQQAQFYNTLTPPSTKIAYKEVQKNNLQQQLKPLQEKRLKIKAELQLSQKQLEINMTNKDTVAVEKSFKKVNSLTQDLAKSDQQILKRKNNIADIQAEINKQKILQTNLQFKQLKSDQERIKKLQKQLELQKKKEDTINKKKQTTDEKTTKTKEEKEVTVKGIEQSEKKIKKLLQQKNEILLQLGIPQFKQIQTLNKQIQDLQNQRKKIVISGDAEGLKKIDKQILETKAKLVDINKKTINVGLSIPQYRQLQNLKKQLQDLQSKQKQIVLTGNADDVAMISKQIQKAKEKIASLQSKEFNIKFGVEKIKQIDNLKKQLQELQNQRRKIIISGNADKLKEVDQQIKKTMDKISTVQKKVIDIKLGIPQYKQLQDLKKKLQDLQGKRKKIEVDGDTKGLVQIDKQIAETKNKISSVQNLIVNIQMDFPQFKQLQDLKKQLQNLQKQRNQIKVNGDSKQLSQIDKKILQTKNNILSMEKQTIKIKLGIPQITQFENLKKKLQDLQKQHNEIEISGDTKKLKVVDQQIKKIEKKIHGLGNKSVMIKLGFSKFEQLQQLQKQLKDLQEKRNQIKVNGDAKGLQKIEKQIKKTKEKIEKAENDIENMNVKISPLRGLEQFEQAKKQLFDYENKLDQLNEKLSSTKDPQKRTEIIQQIKQVKVKRDEAGSKLGIDYSDLQYYSKRLEVLKEQRKKLFDNISDPKIKVNVQEAFAEIDRLQKKKEEIEKGSISTQLKINTKQIEQIEEIIKSLDLKLRLSTDEKEKTDIQQSIKKYSLMLDELKQKKADLDSQKTRMVIEDENIDELSKKIHKLKVERFGLLEDLKLDGISDNSLGVDVIAEEIKKIENKKLQIKYSLKPTGTFKVDILKQLKNELDQNFSKILNLQKQLEKLKKVNSKYSTAEGQKKSKQYQEQIIKAKIKQLQLQAQIDELTKKSKAYYDKQKASMDQQLQVQKLLLQGKYDQAQKLKLINQLKEQGLIIDNKEVDALLKQKKALADLNIDRSIKQQGQSILDGLGANNRQYQYEKKIRELEEANKTSLSDDQKDKVKKIVDIQFDMKKAENLKPNFSDMSIKTNELTARGGFASGAVVPDIDLVNKQIRDYQAKSYSTLSQIKSILQKGGII